MSRAYLKQRAVLPCVRDDSYTPPKVAVLVIDGVEWRSREPENAAHAATINRDAEGLCAILNQPEARR